MDLNLLHAFVREAGTRLNGRRIRACGWQRPILEIEFNSEPRLVWIVVLGRPGPLCFLDACTALAPRAGRPALDAARGRTVESLSAEPNQREIRVTLSATATSKSRWLRMVLHGAAGRVECGGDGDVLQTVGGRSGPDRSAVERHGEVPIARPASLPRPFWLVSTHISGPFHTARAPGTAGANLGPFADAVSASEQAGHAALSEVRDGWLRRARAPLDRLLKSRERLIECLREDRARAERHLDVRHDAEALAAYRDRVRGGVSQVELPDPYDPARNRRIDVDPAVPISDQIDRRFTLAARLARGLSHINLRLETVIDESEQLRRAVQTIRDAESFEDAWNETARALGNWERPSGARRPSRASTRTPPPHAGHRRIDLDDGWYALVGRSNTENDVLTFRVARPDDWWFHAHSVPGSHVVLKRDGGRTDAPPPRILERTAAIAASHSKAKHSRLVAVIYTRRKYVRKPRGAAPGRVTCEREKLIMVAPVR